MDGTVFLAYRMNGVPLPREHGSLLLATRSLLTDFAWVIWRYEWKTNQKGNFRLRVRATDKKGNIEESGSLLARSYPHGARGIQEIKVGIT
ncbi:MAG: hypothetical protein ABSF90_00640 [Syntrophobacteraceae bacterium]|jgi:hypothetical protein